jgi:ATP-dependent DNA helicase RecQ
MGEIRSLLYPHVCILAMTATISQSSRKHVEQLIGMKNPVVVSASPCKPNVYYSVVKCASSDISEIFSPVLDDIMALRTNMPRTMIFCRTMNDCSSLYIFVKQRLKKISWNHEMPLTYQNFD